MTDQRLSVNDLVQRSRLRVANLDEASRRASSYSLRHSSVISRAPAQAPQIDDNLSFDLNADSFDGNTNSLRATLESAKIAENETRSVAQRSKGGSEATAGVSPSIMSKAITFSVEDEERKNKKGKAKISSEQNMESNQENDEAKVTRNDWNAEGADMLSGEYRKGLNQRLFLGGTTNVNEHKRMIRDLQILRVQRQREIRKNDHLITEQRQKIMKGKEDFQNKIAAAQQAKRGKKKVKAAAAPPIAMPRLFHPEYTHRKTQVNVNELALLAKGMKGAKEPSRLGQVIIDSIKDMPAKLYKLGLIDDKEGAMAELLLEIRDTIETVRGSKSSLLTNLSMDAEIQAIIMANRRKEIVESIIEDTQKEIENRKVKGSFSREIMKGESKAAVGSEEDPNEIMKTLELHSKLLQSHPFVTRAILLGGNIPQNLGGLGGRDFGREEKIKMKVKKSDSMQDSFDLLQQEETKKGYCTVLGLLRAVNFIETKSVKNRISKWCKQMATEKMASTQTKTKYKQAEELIPLRTI